MSERSNLSRYMRDTGTRQTDLAHEVGIAQSHLCGIVLGRKRPSVTVVLALARATGMTAGQVLDAEPYPAPEAAPECCRCADGEGAA